MSDILIVGTGALATLFAARLASTGVDVTLMGTWKNGMDALKRDGARLLMADGRELASPVRVVDDPEEVKNAKMALVLVKAWQTQRAAEQLSVSLAPDGLAVTLQNGLGNREILASVLGKSRVALGVTTTGATLLGPGLARSGGDGSISVEGHPRIGLLESPLRDAGFRVDILPDARTLVWGKLVINAAINPLTALLGVPNGELLKRPSARVVMGSLAREAARVAGAHGVSLPFNDPTSAAEDVARRTASNRSSMFQDVRRGAPTEIDAISGAVVRAGREKGIRAPINWAMWQLVRALYPTSMP
jgi:2-dehydropantoate 2-reductase